MNKLSDNQEVKERIKKELYQCIIEMPYNKITVKNLVSRLGMSRQNFYRYYMSKDEILLDLIDDMLDAAYQVIELNINLISENVNLITDRIQELIAPRKEFINEILSCSNEKIVFSHLHRFVRRIVGRLLRESDQKDVDQDYMDIVISKYTGSGYYLVKSWAQIDGELDESKFRRLIFNFVNGLLSEMNDTLDLS